jgi:hypothetical protein
LKRPHRAHQDLGAAVSSLSAIIPAASGVSLNGATAAA